MSLPKMVRFPPVRLLSSIQQQQQQQQQLLLRCIAPVPVPRSMMQSSYRRPGQPKENRFPLQPFNFSFSKGLEGIKKHFTLMKNEFVERWTGPQGKSLLEYVLEPNQVVFEFRGPESLEQWTLSSDHEIGGSSEIHIKLGRNSNTCFLYGTLCSTPPNDGETRYSGYCSMRSKQQLAALDRKKHFDLSNFNSLHLRVRGDGRPWMINIAAETFFTHTKDDVYSYFLYTRGGPYWQDVKIPFSKFFISSRGRIQDNQHPLWLDKINTIGFTLGDDIDGPFQLEIDFIGVSKDYAHTEEFAYEMYEKNPKV